MQSVEISSDEFVADFNILPNKEQGISQSP